MIWLWKEIWRNAQNWLINVSHYWVSLSICRTMTFSLAFPNSLKKACGDFVFIEFCLPSRPLKPLPLFSTSVWLILELGRVLFKRADLLDFQTFLDPVFIFHPPVGHGVVETFFPLVLAVLGKIRRGRLPETCCAHCWRFSFPILTRAVCSWIIIMASFSWIRQKLHTEQSDNAR